MKFKKITECTVIQTFENGACLSQELVAANESSFEDMNGKPVDCPEYDGRQPYMHFDMVQPERRIDELKQRVKLRQEISPSGIDLCFQGFIRGAEIAALVKVATGPDSKPLALDNDEFANMTFGEIIEAVNRGVYAISLVEALSNCDDSEIEIHDVEVK